ncbi:MAG: hypothetical protein FVQ85_21070 [Planctomycetes bacterium]|nr:hypothetical protein [Planctomycetota bacterium]
MILTIDIAFRILQGLLTPVIACIAVYIAYQQHKTNRDKLRLDLYNKRYEVFYSLMKLLERMKRTGKIEPQHINEFLKESKEDVFLFDNDIVSYLETVRKKAFDFWATREELKDMPRGDERNKKAREITDLMHWLGRQVGGATDKFGKYLKFEQRLKGKPVNLKKGFRRLAFASAIFIAIICAGLSVVLVHLIHSNAQINLQWKQNQFKEKYGEHEDSIKALQNEKPIEEYTSLAPEKRQRLQELLKKQRNFLEDSGAMEAKVELDKLENGFCVNLSKNSLVGVYTLAALVGVIIGFIIIWLIYKFLEWLALGFCDDEQNNK